MHTTVRHELEQLDLETGQARERFLEHRNLDSWFDYFERLIQVRQVRKRSQDGQPEL